MDLLLGEIELRVLGCLIEKEMATPDYYPLSLNALQNACNQKTNRHPIASYDEGTILVALTTLKKNGLAYQSDSGRVPKYAETFVKSYKLLPKEAALLCVLMLRGPQTLGELRGRTERMFHFSDLKSVDETLTDLEMTDVVVKLPRQPGCKESRFAHLLAGDPMIQVLDASPSPDVTEDDSSSPEDVDCQPEKSPTARITELEDNLAQLREEFDALKKMIVGA